ncbi:hypothetical protein D3C80_1705780 [compost metagenome]
MEQILLLQAAHLRDHQAGHGEVSEQRCPSFSRGRDVVDLAGSRDTAPEKIVTRHVHCPRDGEGNDFMRRGPMIGLVLAGKRMNLA